MKLSWLPTALTGILCLVSVMVFLQGARFFWTMRQMQRARGELATIELIQISVRNLTEECLAYSQANPALTPLLQQFDVRGSRAAGTQAPAAGRAQGR